MKQQQLNEFKEILEKEKSEIEQQLAKIAVPSETKPGEWETKYPSHSGEAAHIDMEREADAVEEYGANVSVTKSLQIKLDDLNIALAKMADGTYGKCENCGQDVPIERLKAFPTARICFDCASVK